MTQERHPLVLRLVHWTTAALVLSLLALGLSMVDSLAQWRTTGLRLHKLGGVLVLCLTSVRMFLRVVQRSTLAPLPTVSREQALGMRLVHVTLYTLLIAVPISGWLMQNAAGNPVYLVGATTLPQLVGDDLVLYGALREAHSLLTTLLVLALLAHIGGALHDGLVSRRGLMQRMWR